MEMGTKCDLSTFPQEAEDNEKNKIPDLQFPYFYQKIIMGLAKKGLL